MNTLRKTAMSAMGVLSMLAFQVLMLAIGIRSQGRRELPEDRRLFTRDKCDVMLRKFVLKWRARCRVTIIGTPFVRFDKHENSGPRYPDTWDLARMERSRKGGAYCAKGDSNEVGQDPVALAIRGAPQRVWRPADELSPVRVAPAIADSSSLESIGFET